MRVVVDTPLVAAALLHPDGAADTILQRPDVNPLVPAPILRAVEHRGPDLARRADCPPDAWEERVDWFLAGVEPLADEAILAQREHKLVRHAAQLSPAAPLLVGALVASSADHLWTPDPALHEALPGAATPRLPSSAGPDT